ncbi:hypothetical protein CONLIGDRAFT_480374 [Coniochaeta ligniaria NRRL 30616]|uniref:Uncharacterized protein n=1 Tax=Coniochaeta ligniaria NRRL 30616 TaxID=1408157 RepID=A0A1J7JBG9_9PEZI|nr:hypothetical protein CONLIGDRAFT_480374 [Coniochaeta ligniaria NRRL 30616]
MQVAGFAVPIPNPHHQIRQAHVRLDLRHLTLFGGNRNTSRVNRLCVAGFRSLRARTRTRLKRSLQTFLPVIKELEAMLQASEATGESQGYGHVELCTICAIGLSPNRFILSFGVLARRSAKCALSEAARAHGAAGTASTGGVLWPIVSSSSCRRDDFRNVRMHQGLGILRTEENERSQHHTQDGNVSRSGAS